MAPNHMVASAIITIMTPLISLVQNMMFSSFCIHTQEKSLLPAVFLGYPSVSPVSLIICRHSLDQFFLVKVRPCH